MRRYFPILIVLGCAAAFAFGLVRLFELRFEAGDVYPPYSSLRSDPLGTMALYESLEKMPGISTRRDYSASDQMPEGHATTYLHLAASSSEWTYEWNGFPQDTFREIERFLARGGRLVVTFFPQTEKPYTFTPDDESGTNSIRSARQETRKTPKNEKMSPPKSGRKKKPRHDSEWGIDLAERWGFHTDFKKLGQGEGDGYEPVRVVNRSDLPLPRALDWHSGIVFTNLDPAWRTIYARGTNAVVMERRFGPGTVVLSTDSYFLSNEALQNDRHADFLAWLIGPNRNVVFDEAHLGVMETSGVAVLMRQYHLQGLVAGLILLAGLFIWKNSLSLVPLQGEDMPREYVAGKEAAAGFVNLLRRNIAPRDVLATCFAEWKKSAAQSGRCSSARRQQAEAIFSADQALAARERDPLRTYRMICNVLKTRNSKTETRDPEPETSKPEPNP